MVAMLVGCGVFCVDSAVYMTLAGILLTAISIKEKRTAPLCIKLSMCFLILFFFVFSLLKK